MEQQKQLIAEVKQAELDNLSKNGPPAKKQRRVHKVDRYISGGQKKWHNF